MKTLTRQWSEKRNGDKVKIHWSFTMDKAREKMTSQYAKINNKN